MGERIDWFVRLEEHDEERKKVWQSRWSDLLDLVKECLNFNDDIDEEIGVWFSFHAWRGGGVGADEQVERLRSACMEKWGEAPNLDCTCDWVEHVPQSTYTIDASTPRIAETHS